MKKFNLLLIPLYLISSAVLAQAPMPEETIYVVRLQNRTEIPAELCDAALPLLGGQPLFLSFSSDLYSILTKNKNGSLMKIKQKVGTLVGCWAEPTLGLERGIPTLDFGSVNQMTLNGSEYTITGSQRLRTDPFSPPYGFPVPNTGMSLGTSTGTVYKSFFTTLPPVVVGSLSCTWLSDPSQSGTYEELATCTISLYE